MSRPVEPRLPWAPLAAAGLTDGQVAELTGVSRRTVIRYAKIGVPVSQADRFAVALLGLPDFAVWPEIAELLDRVAEELEERRRRRNADWQRHRYQNDPEWAERQRARSRRLYAETAEYVKASKRAAHQARREQENARSRAYYEANRDRVLARQRARRQQNNNGATEPSRSHPLGMMPS